MNLLENPTNKIILSHLTEGLTVKEVADKVCLSKKAVEKRIWHMKQFTGVKNITELVCYSIKPNLSIISESSKM